MILIFFLCIKLSILHLCVSDLGYRCERDDSYNNPEIFLIQDRYRRYFFPFSNNIDLYPDISYQDIWIPDHGILFQNKLNSAFRMLCGNYYNIKVVSLEESKRHEPLFTCANPHAPAPASRQTPSQLRVASMWIGLSKTNVIHFAVPDYYDGKALNNFVYAGNISKIDDAECTKTDNDEPKFDCHEIVNLVSKAVLEIDDGHVYNFVQKMHIMKSRNNFRKRQRFEITQGESCEPFSNNEKTSDLTVVLLCLRGPDLRHKEVIIQPLKLIQAANCSYNGQFNEITARRGRSLNKNRLLAVLAPEPFEIPTEYPVPTIFYDTPYLYSENKTTFPNSLNLVPWRLLKYGFLKFIQTVGWQRVAIVTDDSEYSLDFEDELTALFNKEHIVYTVIRCEDANCKMEKLLQELAEVKPTIVIANVEEKHAQYLFQHTLYLTITWLVRDMVRERQHQLLPSHLNAFSFSLSIDTYTKGCDVETNILTGLSSIAQAYKSITDEDYKVKKLEFYRRFANKAKQVTPRITEATVVVHKLYSSEVISKMTVNVKGAKLISFKNPFISGKPNDGTAHCLVTSNDYHKPCEDPLVMFLMLILTTFMLTFLLIVCYFDKTSPFNDIRYHNF